jgi:hypothetical protein
MKQKRFHDLDSARIDFAYIRNTVLRNEIDLIVCQPFVMRSGNDFQGAVCFVGVVKVNPDRDRAFQVFVGWNNAVNAVLFCPARETFCFDLFRYIDNNVLVPGNVPV